MIEYEGIVEGLVTSLPVTLVVTPPETLGADHVAPVYDNPTTTIPNHWNRPRCPASAVARHVLAKQILDQLLSLSHHLEASGQHESAYLCGRLQGYFH